MKKTILSFSVSGLMLYACNPTIEDIISMDEVERIERTLSADDMEGRRILLLGWRKQLILSLLNLKKVICLIWKVIIPISRISNY
ncbi:hypothetical protein V8V91_04955 [Algoriphagus halophilus]|uniref:hypothetical protein n=1 Tax=Algoriphagus halophilus TaxID=226505 RepID=UPI00358E4B17